MNYNQWQKEFDDRFVDDGSFKVQGNYLEVKDFIKELLISQVEIGEIDEKIKKEAVEGFARWWNVHGGKGEEFITRNSWREYKEHLTQTEGR